MLVCVRKVTVYATRSLLQLSSAVTDCGRMGHDALVLNAQLSTQQTRRHSSCRAAPYTPPNDVLSSSHLSAGCLLLVPRSAWLRPSLLPLPPPQAWPPLLTAPPAAVHPAQPPASLSDPLSDANASGIAR